MGGTKRAAGERRKGKNLEKFKTENCATEVFIEGRMQPGGEGMKKIEVPNQKNYKGSAPRPWQGFNQIVINVAAKPGRKKDRYLRGAKGCV